MVDEILATTDEIWEWLEVVPDPEIPAISVVDLGIIRNVSIGKEGVEVVITPTYSGCPAMSFIASDIKSELARRGVFKLTIKTQIAPPWTTNWLSRKGRTMLESYGIAPPQVGGGPSSCPQCKSTAVEKVSQFGSTPCKAQWRCQACLEPFEYFKCI
ncbi:MAG: phenylacetate-CoA oxygenase subunit PaaJ [Rhodospirillaceae bacterium]|nr:phenylacetate-CoA oxygenase subunit PaaJ [Rhodospirillaceae bacterium]|tara:strand:- start:215 stop:685 length:471 start_codon:yes stop_codon:yes gene_type:complete